MRAIDRLASRVHIAESGCWEWTGALNHGGYGTFLVDGRRMGAHRAAYLLHVGSIPDGLDLDHLCRVRHCVNPAHLEPVTRSENLRRGVGVGKWHTALETCPEGHPYDDSNTYHDARGWRGCRACRSEASRRYRARRAAA